MCIAYSESSRHLQLKLTKEVITCSEWHGAGISLPRSPSFDHFLPCDLSLKHELAGLEVLLQNDPSPRRSAALPSQEKHSCETLPSKSPRCNSSIGKASSNFTLRPSAHKLSCPFQFSDLFLALDFQNLLLALDRPLGDDLLRGPFPGHSSARDPAHQIPCKLSVASRSAVSLSYCLSLHRGTQVLSVETFLWLRLKSPHPSERV